MACQEALWRLAGFLRFNESSRDPVVIVKVGAGILLAIPVAWLLARRPAPLFVVLYLRTLALRVAGASAGSELPTLP